MSTITIEFFGIPRLRAGCAEMTVSADTVWDALVQVRARCPQWRDLTENGALSKHYRISLNGESFITDLDIRIPCNSRLLLLSADVGG